MENRATDCTTVCLTDRMTQRLDAQNVLTNYKVCRIHLKFKRITQNLHVIMICNAKANTQP